MSGRSKRMVRNGVELRWIKKDHWTKRKAKRKAVKIARRKNRD